MFGFSFGEVLLIAVVALVAVGPQKLPGMLRTLGEWARKLRLMTHEMRAQSGIDEILRAEGVHGGLNELRGLMRGQHALPFVPPPAPVLPVSPPPDGTISAPTYSAPALLDDAYNAPELDVSQEYPPEGADAYGVLPDDLFDVPDAPVAHANLTDSAAEGGRSPASTSSAASESAGSTESPAATAEAAAGHDEGALAGPSLDEDPPLKAPAVEETTAPLSSKSASV
ncbi:MAG TPA: twin-arginine translocase TatA/TatE family subunit [Polyangiaceae bacterium]|nr:twin-arginine translocase TatA/TatE family subunit [Polyangiaceae bacterium]